MLTVNARYDRPTLDGAETREDDESSWLGGSLVSAWCCVASITCGYGLVCVGVLPFLCFCLWPYQDEMTQSCRLLHESSNGLVVCHSCGCWFFVWFLFGCFWFFLVFVVCLLLFVLFVEMTAFWAMYRSVTSSLLRSSISRRPRVLIWKLMILRCHGAYWTTWRKPWRRWTEKKIEKMMKACMRPLKVQRPCWITCAQTRVLHCFKNIGWRQIRFNKQPSDWSMQLQVQILKVFQWQRWQASEMCSNGGLMGTTETKDLMSAQKGFKFKCMLETWVA